MIAIQEKGYTNTLNIHINYKIRLNFSNICDFKIAPQNQRNRGFANLHPQVYIKLVVITSLVLHCTH